MSDAVLIVALSGRALAAAARRAGLRPYVLDLFGDRDTLDLAEAHRQVAGDVFGGLTDVDLPDLARAFDKEAGEALPLVYGAGLESRSHLLERLTEGRELCGNRSDAVAAVKDPRVFFAALDRLGIAHPEVRQAPPATTTGWLAKRIGGAGGIHIRPASANAPESDVYFQKRESGDPHGVKFLADGQDARLLAVNRLWTADPRDANCFLFGGMAGPMTLPNGLHEQLKDAVRRLVRHFGLVGLNSLDLLLDGDRLSVLEINPRPGVAIDLYRETGRAGILARHIAACRGDLPDRLEMPPVAGVQVVYAREGTTVAAADAVPEWLVDRPAAGLRVESGEPLCSVLATGSEVEDCRRRLATRSRESLAILADSASARATMP